MRSSTTPTVTPSAEETPKTEVIIQAAGGVLTRASDSGDLEIAIIHRHLREDWSFPKGKREVGESYEECALREVEEETGYSCRLGRFIGHTVYRDRKDRPKVVAYWLMEIVSGDFTSNEEADEIVWVDLASASRTLTYDRDRELLGVIQAAIEETATAA